MAGSIEKRGKDSYRLVVSGGIGPDGKRKKYTKTVNIDGKTEPERQRKAQVELAKMITTINNNTFVEPSKLTFNDFIQKWLKEYAEKNLAPKTLFRYKQMLNSRIIPALGHIKLNKLKPIHFVEFYNNLQENGIRNDKKPGGLSPLTIKHHHRLIHTILETAVKWQLLLYNPADKVTPPKVPKKEAKYLEENDIKLLLNAINSLNKENLKYKVAIYITISGGLRLGELMGLKWENINFKKNLISIVRSNQYLPHKGTFSKSTKNESSERTITLPKEVMVLLKKYKIYQNEKRLKCGSKWNNTNFIFTQWNGIPMNPYTVSSWFHKFLIKNNLKKVTFHQLRHTSASILINEGVNIKEVSKRLGHSNASTTLNIYSHVLKSADKVAANAIEKVMFKSKKKKSKKISTKNNV